MVTSFVSGSVRRFHIVLLILFRVLGGRSLIEMLTWLIMFILSFILFFLDWLRRDSSPRLGDDFMFYYVF